MCWREACAKRIIICAGILLFIWGGDVLSWNGEFGGERSSAEEGFGGGENLCWEGGGSGLVPGIGGDFVLGGSVWGREMMKEGSGGNLFFWEVRFGWRDTPGGRNLEG